MEEEKFSEEESLLLIQSMINRVQDRFGENGHLYLLWGWVVFICSLSQLIMLRVLHINPKETSYVWILVWIALVYQIIYIRKERKRRRVRTYTGDILAYVWIAFGISMILIAFILSINHQFILVNPVTLVIYGIPTFLSGIILRFRYLVLGGIFCWILSVFCTRVMDDYQLLFIALAVLVAWIFPGYRLRNQFKNQKQE